MTAVARRRRLGADACIDEGVLMLGLGDSFFVPTPAYDLRLRVRVYRAFRRINGRGATRSVTEGGRRGIRISRIA